MKRTNAKNDNKKINRGFSMVELVIVIAILAILIAVLAPSLMTYTERSRAQKDVTTMDEVVNAVQLAMADQDCYDEMIKYSCDNNFITYTDSSGNYGQVIADGEYWAPDGLGRATTITFNPEKDSEGNTIYKLSNAIVNDMTYGNGSVAENRVMQGNQIDNNQCYLKNASLNGSQTGYLYNRIRQSIGDDVITTSATYANSSFTIFIRFNQKDGVTVADVNGSFNGTNLTADAPASKGSGTNTSIKDPNTGSMKPGNPSNPQGGTTNTNYSSSALQGGGTFNGVDYKANTEEAKEGITAILYSNGSLVFQASPTMNPKYGEIVLSYPGKDDWLSETYTSNSQVPWYSNRTSIKTVIFDCAVAPTSTAYWFYEMTNCTSMSLAKLDTSNVTNMSGMFAMPGILVQH